jgi:hypothetical protein
MCAPSNIIRVIKVRSIRWTEHIEHLGGMRNAYNILVGTPERNRRLGRHRHRWEDNIRMDLRGIG